ncbi:MAG: hypothetical protein A2289_20030 [Deltaproteobacteria bacterium RIFOXYA12_FULL_58_15]|nr:MAG: hypothetical protein A2289_20030 [Deltaproteobacteria bacterium RIFOXYA12_FULL_58_15]OGR07141.1 MAG: hypothetical protein A2341_03325 [Deltaproteobacteria bacterium RIFOXYB12_FULL_58_9]
MHDPPQRFAARIDRLGRIRAKLLALAKRHRTPLYVYDADEAIANLTRFSRAFARAEVPVSIFYAMKSNPYPGLLATICANGHNLDASSAPELRAALAAGPQAIVLTGPAKGREALELALQHRDQVVIHLDSVRELSMVNDLARGLGCQVRCGVRIHTSEQSGWGKFGIPIEELPHFFRRARRHPHIDMRGIHFHGGTHPSPQRVLKTLRMLGEQFALPSAQIPVQALAFVDIGGGVPPEVFQGSYPWNRRQVMSFASRTELLQRILAGDFQPSFEIAEVVPVETFATKIGQAFARHVHCHNPAIRLWAEPGKFISHSVMHFLLGVAETKGNEVVIVDGGTNMVGWEKYEYFDYVPIFNLTRFAPHREVPTLVYGNLCTPHDLWGYYVRGRALRHGDLLCLPYQGAYTYTLAQAFIRGVPPVVELANQ